MDSPTDISLEPSCCHGQSGRNLIVCIDGTSNQFGIRNTNVVELYNLTLKQGNQRSWYNRGIGTDETPRDYINHAFALDFKQTVLDAYQWLSDNYEEGDRIFLFGFSRGAYQVRVLAAMVDKVGLIHKGNKRRSTAFDLYANAENDKTSQVGSTERFKRAFSREVTVHFVGAWDTVSSIGITLKIYPGTVDGMEHVCYFRHALALDERRVSFQPEYAYGGRTGRKNEISQNMGLEKKYPHILEVWFAGTHSDIGGRNGLNAGPNCPNPPLRWMVLEAMTFGLRVVELGEEFLKTDNKIEVTECLKSLWWIPEILPSHFSPLPHFGSFRKVQPGQRIHHSVLSAKLGGYSPGAHPPDDMPQLWDNLQNSTLLYYDLCSQIQIIVHRLVNGNSNEPLEDFECIARLLHGPQSVYTIIIAALDADERPININQKHKVVESLMEFLEKASQGKLRLTTRIPKFLSQFLEDEEYKKTAVAFMAKYTSYCTRRFDHKRSIQSVAFSHDGTQIVSGSEDMTILIWNVKTGEAGKPLKGHLRRINSVAFSLDGNHVVSGSSDKTIRIWDVETGKQVGKPFQGHWHHVNSVDFSPDGKRVVSGSSDKTVRIWDVRTGKPLGKPFSGHSGWVLSVAFSHGSGEYVVSGSDDRTICIWNVNSGEPTVLRGHSGWVRSVAFSPNNDRVVSGSDDMTVCIRDVVKRRRLGEPLSGHSQHVSSVAFSPGGHHVISGSWDKTIRIWDVKTGEQLGESFTHSGRIHSVAFSHDGECVVSGSDDGATCIWNVKTAQSGESFSHLSLLWRSLQKSCSFVAL